MTAPTTASDEQLERARSVLAELGLREDDELRIRPVSGHASSLLVPCVGQDGKRFALKLFLPPAPGRPQPAGVKTDDYARRESAFYRFLDSVDPGRVELPAPRSVVLDAGDPPQWILLEWIDGAVGPKEEVLGQDQIFDLLGRLRAAPLDRMLGRRDFPLEHHDVVSYLERARLMYDELLPVLGQRRWRAAISFFDEAIRWTESRPNTLVHGDFTEQNILVDADGRPYLIDFERLGFGNEDHDFAWLWLHSERSQEWKRALLARHFGGRFGSDRIKSEWGIRATLVFLALRRLRFGFLTHGERDPFASRNVALFDAAVAGGPDLFPV